MAAPPDDRAASPREDLGEHVSALHNELAQLSALIAHLFGTDDFDITATERELSRLEAIVASEPQWPATFDAADELYRDVDTLVASYPPLVQDSLLSRLVPLRWSVEALTARVHPIDEESHDLDHTIATLDDLLQGIDELLLARPRHTCNKLAEALEARRLEAQDRLDRVRYQRAVEHAHTVLAGDDGALDSAWHELDGIQADDKELDLLKDRLRNAVIASEVTTRGNEIKGQLTRFKTHDDFVLRQVAISRLHEEAAALKLDLFLVSSADTTECPRLNDATGQVDALLENIRNEQRLLAREEEAQQQDLRRRYQKWALAEINKFNQWRFDQAREHISSTFANFKAPEKPFHWPLLSEFPGVRAFLGDKVDVPLPDGAELTPDQQKNIYGAVARLRGWHYLDELAHLVVREAAVKYLLPVEQSLLEPAVQHVYANTFHHAWSLSEKGGHELYIAEQTHTVKKVTLSSLSQEGASK